MRAFLFAMKKSQTPCVICDIYVGGPFFWQMDGVFACWIFVYFNMCVFHLVFRGFDLNSVDRSLLGKFEKKTAGKYPH